MKNKTVWLLPLIAVILSAISVILLYSLNANEISRVVTARNWKVQLGASLIGAVGAAVILRHNCEKLAKRWYVYTVPLLVMTLLTFTPLGLKVDTADDKAWLNLGFTSLQPSELLKIAFILSFSFHIAQLRAKNADMQSPKKILPLFAHAAVPLILVALQGDYGTALIFLIMFLVMFFTCGVSWKYIAAICAAIPLFGTVMWNFIMNADQRARLSVIFALEENADGYGYQQVLSRQAIAGGGITGQGLFGGKYSYVPEIQNDFILSYVSQTFGLLGLLAILILSVIFLIVLLKQAEKAKNILSKTIYIGVFAMFTAHFFLNAGMVLGIMPVIGIPFPFLSSGGTACISMYGAVGAALSASRVADKKYSSREN